MATKYPNLEHIQNLVKIYHFVFKILSGNKVLNEILKSIKGLNSMKNAWKMICNNTNLDLININAYTKFYQFFLKILSGNEIMRDRMTVWRAAKTQYSPPFSKWGYKNGHFMHGISYEENNAIAVDRCQTSMNSNQPAKPERPVKIFYKLSIQHFYADHNISYLHGILS